MARYELHVATPIGGAPTLDPSCLAAVWLCEDSVLDIAIMSSGNVHLSPTYTLPVLLDTEAAEPTAVAGLPEIAALVMQRSLEPLELGLLAFYQRLAVITQWTLFVVPENYESVTRPDISGAVPFPMQYNAAIALQRAAKANQPVRKADKKKTGTEPVNKLHEAMIKQNEIQSKAKDLPKQAMARVSDFVEIVDTSRPALESLAPGNAAEMLLAANLVLMGLTRLPVKPFESLIGERPDLAQLRDQGRAKNFQLAKLTTVPDERAYSLWNTTMAYIGYAKNRVV